MRQLPWIKLRAIEPEDLELLYQVENDPELWDVGMTNVPYSRYALHEYIASVTGDIYTDKQLRLIIESSEGDTVGIIDLANYNPRHHRAEVGIVIQAKYRDRGYGRAALAQLIKYAREVIHLHQMYALVSKHNDSCLSLMKEIGFQDVALLKDWMYSGDRYYDVVVLQYFLKNN